jgi:hypothetical protein
VLLLLIVWALKGCCCCCHCSGVDPVQVKKELMFKLEGGSEMRIHGRLVGVLVQQCAAMCFTKYLLKCHDPL